MQIFRKHFLLSKLAVVVAAVCLLFQIQPVFACHMMDYKGPLEHCCCKHKMHQSADDTSSMSCCSITADVSLTNSGLEDTQAATLPSAEQYPQLLVLAVSVIGLVHWDSSLARHSLLNYPSFETLPSNPGTATFLSTLRLRI